jgi:hypothetical protein
MSIKDYDVSLHLNVIESAILKLAKTISSNKG